ncbi:MAG: cytidylate kinase [Pelagibacteraceae bacterium TMED237]|nr:MAG: cytidylate kinase [Pelagibacteraceae bacterium TMED237]
MLKKIIITLDGPAASGKERIAKYISKKYNLKHLDSGILYRRLALILINKKANLSKEKILKKILREIKKISYRKHKSLRSERISNASSKIAVYKFIRNYINNIQRKFVKNDKKYKGFVVDGRDIGSVVFKNADLKLYISVNERIRAERRYKQLIDSGEQSIYPKILKDIKLRDKKDKNRTNSPLVVPKGAFVINNNKSFKVTKNQIDKLFNRI